MKSRQQPLAPNLLGVARLGHRLEGDVLSLLRVQSGERQGVLAAAAACLGARDDDVQRRRRPVAHEIDEIRLFAQVVGETIVAIEKDLESLLRGGFRRDEDHEGGN